MKQKCFCGKPATVLIDSDSIQYQQGQPVCDEHDTGDRPEDVIMPFEAWRDR